MAFIRASKKESKLRLALVGPSGSGKTYTALSIAKGLGQKVAAVDTEHKSMSKYADLFDFDVVEPDSYNPQELINTIGEAERAGYDVLIIDSLSHYWMGKDGELEQVDKAAKRSNSGNSFTAWKEVTPLHNRLVDTMLAAKLHIIVTMRVKTEWVLEKNSRGNMEPRKVGLSPIMRDGIEFEFDVVGDLNQENELIVTKTRCPVLAQGIYKKAGKDVSDILTGWLHGAPVPEASPILVEVSPVPAQNPMRGLTDPQRRKLFATLKEKVSGSEAEQQQALKGFMSALFQKTSTKELTHDEFDLLMSNIQDGSLGQWVRMQTEGMEQEEATI